MSRIFDDGISFTETYQAGKGTDSGQLAAQCSIIYFPEFPVMLEAPNLPSVCLSDVFYEKEYSTNFFYRADIHFDNQDTFYPFHKMVNIFDKRSYPENSATGGWGVSDLELVNFASEQLMTTKKPFFATILTLTNHGPFALPKDAPDFIDRNQDIRLQILQYVDWVWGEFYDKFIQNHPHTIMVFIEEAYFWIVVESL